METASSNRTPTEEIQNLGKMLTATTIEDTGRLESIINQLHNLVYVEKFPPTIGTVEPIYDHTERSVEITAFLRGFVAKYKENPDLRVKDIFDYLLGLLNG